MAIKTVINKVDNPSQSLDSQEISKICALSASDKKASDIVILDIGKLTSFADYFVICSAPSERQVKAIIANVENELKKHKIRPLSVEGQESCSWVLLDFGDVIFHCFTDSAREYYDLEGFWIDADRIEFE
jgi:ribosome-associated protein